MSAIYDWQQYHCWRSSRYEYTGAMDPQRFVFLDSDPDLDPWIKIQGAKYQPKPVITKLRYTIQHWKKKFISLKKQ